MIGNKGKLIRPLGMITEAWIMCVSGLEKADLRTFNLCNLGMVCIPSSPWALYMADYEDGGGET